MHCTILMPAYNTEKHIVDAMQSVFLQSYKDWDLLVVNDGSVDQTRDIVLKYIPFLNISLIDIKHSGVAEATRVGLEEAQGPVVTILDSDDKLYPNSLETVMPYFMKDPKLGFVWSMFMLSGGRTGWSHPLPGDATSLWDALVNKGWWKAAHQRWIRLKYYKESRKLNGKIPTSSDLQLAMVMADTKCKTMHVPSVSYWYRQDGNKRRISIGQRSQQQLDAGRILAEAKNWDIP